MTNDKFERAARINKTKAFFLTVALHIMLIAGISSYGKGSVADLVPDKVKSLLGWEQNADQTQDKNDEVALRP